MYRWWSPLYELPANVSYTEGVGFYTCVCDDGFHATSATAAFDSDDLHCEVDSYTYTYIHVYSIVNDQGEARDPLVGGIVMI